MYILLLITLVCAMIYSFYLYSVIMNTESTCNQAWKNLNLQLERRYKLLKALAELMEFSLDDKKAMFEKIMENRKIAMDIHTPYEKGKAEKTVLYDIKMIFALSNEHPELLEKREFTDMRNLAVEIEEYLQETRKSYNAAVSKWNHMRETFPISLMAKLLRLKTKEFFQPNEPYEKLPDIKLQ